MRRSAHRRGSNAKTPTATFFNLFAAVKPHISVTITHGTPCNDQWVQQHRQNGIFRVSGDRCPQWSQEAENLWGSESKVILFHP